MATDAAAEAGGGTATFAAAAAASPLQAGLQSGMRGMFLGLVLGTIWGVWEVRRGLLPVARADSVLLACPCPLVVWPLVCVGDAPACTTGISSL